MARGVFSATNYLLLSSGIITATPLTMSCWAYPTSSSTSEKTLMGIFYTAGAAALPDGWYIQINPGNTVKANTGDGVGTNGTSSAGTVNLNAWNHISGVFTSTTNRNVYLNGTPATASTGSRVPSASPDKTAIGVRIEQNASVPTTSDADNIYIAECAWWNAALTADDETSLSKGFSPLLIKPANLVALHTLIRGDASGDEISLKNASHKMIEQGTLPIQNHCRVFLPTH